MITRSLIDEALRQVLPRIAYGVRPDVLHALERVVAQAANPREASVLSQLIENDIYAHEHQVPGCQDTGTVWISLEVGVEEGMCADALFDVDTTIAATFASGALRKSTVYNALFDRSNRGDNTPAFVQSSFRPGKGATLSVMLKGGGSDNASRLIMLAPGAGEDGVKRVVLETVKEKAANACPPLVIGVGVGATFDTVASLAKHALLREIGSPAHDAAHHEFEQELLALVNQTGIGAAGLGGNVTALAVHLETAPCHIAALPVAVNMGCSAMRSAQVEILDGEIVQIVGLPQ